MTTIAPRTGATLVALSHPDHFLGYTLTQEAWWADAVANKDEVLSIALHATGGGVTWEFMISDVPLGQGRSALRIGIFDDAWEAFTTCPDLFAGLARLGQDAATEDVVELLDECGFRDVTEREVPAHVVKQQEKIGRLHIEHQP